MTRARIVVVSDRAVVDPDENRAGPILAEALERLGCTVQQQVVGADQRLVRVALTEAVAESDVVLTTGGTGIRPGDVVPDVTRELGLDELPGISEEIRRRGAAKTSVSLLSRAVAGLVTAAHGRVLVINAPSSRGGARDVAG
uniref:MogA/MoaB family molybdenum cofactor biosynthesis protein n=1 Tax=Luteococcus sp. TaxID=1969402 RepID=UPI003734D3D3